MAYITKEDAKIKRDLVKKMYPAKDGWKFSITVKNYSSLNVQILKAPFQLLEEKNLNRGNEMVKEYSIDTFYKGKKRDFLKKIYEILNKGNYNNNDTMTDYFDVGFYLNIEIGKYDRPFLVS